MIKEYFKPKQKPVISKFAKVQDNVTTRSEPCSKSYGVQRSVRSNVNPSLRSKGGKKIMIQLKLSRATYDRMIGNSDTMWECEIKGYKCRQLALSCYQLGTVLTKW